MHDRVVDYRIVDDGIVARGPTLRTTIDSGEFTSPGEDRPVGSPFGIGARASVNRRRFTDSAVGSMDDSALFHAMLAGSDPAFFELFQRFQPRLERYVGRQLGRDAPTEDLLQELWERVIKLRLKPPKRITANSGSATEEVGEFKTQAFLFRIAHNLCIDHLRAKKDQTSLSLLGEADHPRVVDRAASVIVGDALDAEELVARALEELPFEFREVLVLNLYGGYRFDEIAVMLEKSPDAIWARASRARAKLRRLVIELAEQEGVSLKDYTDK